MIKKIIICMTIILSLFACWFYFPSEADKEFEKAFKIKKQNPKDVIFDGVLEPDIPVDDDTLLGIDSNRNGVRDDVEIWINRSEDTYNKRMSLKQHAADLQYLLSSAEKDDVDLISHATSVSYSSSICVTYVFNGREGLDAIKKLEKVVYNSRKRQKALENIVKHNFVYGTIIKDLSTKEDYRSCNFKLIK